MGVPQNVVLERGLLRVIERPVRPGEDNFAGWELAYDVAIDGHEVLHSFLSLHEALQFVDMVAPTTAD